MSIFKVIAIILITIFSLNINLVYAKELNPQNPDGYKQFRLDYSEMTEIANPNCLKHRIFYEAPSKGANAKWFDAVKQGDLDTIKLMVQSGQDIEVKDEASYGQTALGWAAFIGYEDIVNYLLDSGANVWATDRADVNNVLKSAGLGKNVEVFKIIYEHMKDQIDIDDQAGDSQGETLLIVAASNNRADIIKFLLSKGANPNLVTTVEDKNDHAYDQSALSFACDRHQTEAIKVLIENGAINHRTGHASCE